MGKLPKGVKCWIEEPYLLVVVKHVEGVGNCAKS